MKNKKIVIIFVAILSLIAFTACKNAPIFAAIENEVKLNKLSVAGSIVCFAKVGDNLYTANPKKVFTKKVGSTGNWTSIGVPGKIILGLASDGTNLFVAFNEGGVHYYDGSWHKVSGSDGIKTVFGNVSIFGVTNNKEVYKITKTGIGSKIATTEKYLVGSASDYFATASKVYKNGIEEAVALEEDDKEKIKAICKGPGSDIFILAGSTVYQHGSALKKKNIDEDKTPVSMFYYEDKKILLIGCKEGYTEIKLKNDNLEDSNTKQISPGNVYSTTPPGVYSQFNSAIGKYSLKPIFAVKHSSGSGYSIFAGVSAGSLTKNTGLWAYHSSGKQEWNRE